MNVESIPIIKLTVEKMTNTICSYMGIENSELEKLIRQRVKEINIEKKVNEMVAQELDHAIREAVTHYFRFGEGEEKVSEAIRNQFKIKKSNRS